MSPRDQDDDTEERAAILEFDGGMFRESGESGSGLWAHRPGEAAT